MSEWISVDDRLPEYTSRAGGDEFVHVIGCIGFTGFVGEAMYRNGRWEILGVVGPVTHWMPLPEPPAEVFK